MKKFWKVSENIILTAIIIFSLFIIMSSLSVFGNRVFVVKSGSMEPKIRTGSIVLVKKAPIYKEGDVITFRKGTEGQTVTHRIIKVENQDSRTQYVVKGDANNTADLDPVPADTVVGVSYFSIPFLGYITAFVRTLPGLILLIIVPATIIIFQELKNIYEEIKAIRARKRQPAPTGPQKSQPEPVLSPPKTFEDIHRIGGPKNV